MLVKFPHRFALALSVFALLGLLAGGCSLVTRLANSPSADYVVPQGANAKAIARGKTLFETKCQKCHGENAGGTWRMPALVGTSYGPKKFKDRSFHIAVMNGARSRNWMNFKDMQPIKDLSEEDAKAILQYVRDLQKQVGIF